MARDLFEEAGIKAEGPRDLLAAPEPKVDSLSMAQGGGVLDKIKNLVLGQKEDYPEVPQTMAGNPFDARTPEGQIQILRKAFPQAEIAGQDKFGNPLIRLGQMAGRQDNQSAYGMPTDQKFYLNKPGVSFQDIEEVKSGAKRAVLPVAASAVMAPVTALAAVPAVGMSGAVSEGLGQAEANVAGAKEGYSIPDMLKTGVYAGLGEGAGRIISSLLGVIVNKLTGLIPRKVVSQTGDISDEAVLALKNAGIGPEDLSAEIKSLLNADIAGGLTPDQAVRSAAFKTVGAKPTTGQLTREFGQQQLEAEGAKSVNPMVGSPIRQRLAESNRAILTKVDDVLAGTGGTADDLVAGSSAKAALRSKASSMQKKTGELYDAAKEATGANSPLPKDAQGMFFQKVVPILDDFEGKIPPAIQKKLEQFGLFGKVERDLTFIEAEKFRKLLNVYADSSDAPTVAAIKSLKGALDDSINSLALGSDDAAKMFEMARKSSAAKHAEFSQKDIVQAVVSKKAQFTDVVPDEQVVKRVVFGGSVDDVFKIRKSLSGAPGGDEAWNNIRASTFKKLMDAAMNQNIKNEAGDVVFSGARFQTELKKLGDKKLSLLFSPKEMEQIHAIRLVADSVTNKVPGSVNTSNTASALLNDAFKKLPFAGSVSDYFVDLGKRKAIKEALTGTAVTKEAKDAALRRRILPKAGVVYGQQQNE